MIPPRLTHISAQAYVCDAPYLLVDWLRADSRLREWRKKADSAYARGELTRFYWCEVSGYRGEASCIIITNGGAVALKGPRWATLAELLNGLCAPAPLPTLPMPMCIFTLGAVAHMDLDWPCDQAAIKLAWKQAAKRLHPDAGGNPDVFILARRAYEDALQLVAPAPTRRAS